MRKLLFLMLIALGYQVNAQLVIGTDTIATRSWVRQQNSGNVSPTLPKCDRVPTVFQIRKIYANSLEWQFDAQGVTSIYQEIVNQATGKVIYSGTSDNLKSNIITINFDTQPAGKYLLRIRAASCTPFDYNERAFEIPSSGSVDPPVVNPDLSYNLRTLTEGFADHMNPAFATTQQDGKITALFTDRATVTPQSGYSFWYQIGSDLVKTATPLRNYVIEGTNPFRIWKAQVKNGIQSLNQWGDENTYYYQTDAGKEFSYNVSFPLNTSVFIPNADVKTGFLNHIPQSYDATSKRLQWADIVEDLKLPKGRVFFVDRGEWGMDLVRQKGVTHISHFQIPRPNGDESTAIKMKVAGETYSDVPTTNITFGLSQTGKTGWSNGYNLAWWPEGGLTDEIADRAAVSPYPDAISIGENLEGDPYMPPTHPGWLRYYTKRRAFLEQTFGAKGIPYYLCHNYFQFWPDKINLGSGSRESMKAQAALVGDAQDVPLFTKGGNLTPTNLIVDGIYLNNPDAENVVYKVIYHMNISRKMGYESGIFLFGNQEFRPNNFFKYVYPEGNFYLADKLPLDPNLIIASSFLSQVYGKVYVDWKGGGKSSETKWGFDYSSGMWWPTGGNPQQLSRGNTGTFPYTPGNRGNYTGSSDLSRFGLGLWSKTFGLTEGGSYEYLTFAIDGVTYNATNNNSDDIVDAYYDKRGIVYSQSLNGQISWFYINPYADNKYHTIKVKLPSGKLVTDFVAGNGIHAKIENL